MYKYIHNIFDKLKNEKNALFFPVKLTDCMGINQLGCNGLVVTAQGKKQMWALIVQIINTSFTPVKTARNAWLRELWLTGSPGNHPRHSTQSREP